MFLVYSSIQKLKINIFKLKNSNLISLFFISLFSRIFYLSLGKTSSLFFQRFDKSSAIKQEGFFNFLESWDSFHFLKIAKVGYTTEHSLPFFPLLPLIVNQIAKLTFQSDNLITVFILFNNLIFIFSSLILYKLSLHFFNPKVSYSSTLFFIFNPSSIIFSSCYTETLFSFLFFLSLFYLINNKMLHSAILLSISTLVRSNSILFILFLNTFHFPIFLLPISCFQLYSLFLVWKSNCSVKWLVPYSFVQKKYWDQGFLRFFTVYNIPNVIIGFPIIVLIFYILSQILRNPLMQNKNELLMIDDKKKKAIHKVPLINKIISLDLSKFILDPFYSNHQITQNKVDSDDSNYKTVVFIKLTLILIFQLVLILFFIHWNITMRFISFNPLIYWMAAILFNKKNKMSVFTITFLAVYGILYTVMFSCFYPPA
jgi:phosphatidylinositol glycan class V